jgi:L-2,4-diaminobutyrate decarboxylase
VGIDFHKTGFCPYVASLFLVQDRKYFQQLNPDKGVPLRDMKYGQYNPFMTTLEYSRSCHGPIAALSSLKALGTDGFRELLGTLVASASYLRERLARNPLVCVIDTDSDGLATMFVLVPPGLQPFSVEELLKFPEECIEQIRTHSVGYGKHVLEQSVTGASSFFFTASRSYSIPGTEIKAGALKMYPMSVFLNREEAERIANEIECSIEEYHARTRADLASVGRGVELFSDMSRPVE